MQLGRFKTIGEPDLPECWIHRNVRVRGYYGAVDGPYDQYVRRDMDSIFREACLQALEIGCPDDAEIVDAKAIDDYGSICFKFRYWGVPER